jgi:protein ImuB
MRIPSIHRPAPDGSPGQLFACLRSTCVPDVIDVLLAIARDFSPRIERHGSRSVVLDVGGLARLLGDAQAIGAALDRAAGEATAQQRHHRSPPIRVAIASTQTAARLMAVARPGLTVTTGEIAAALAPLPIDTLRTLVNDADAGCDRLLDTFHRWGLTTLGEIAALPASDLFERMGQDGLVCHQLARGVDGAPLVPDPAVPRFLQSIALEWPIDALEPLSFVFARLLDPLSAALERADRGAAALRVDLRLVDRTTHARVLQLPAAMREAKVLRTLLLLDLESHPPAAAIDVVTIEIDPAPARIIQYSLLERAMPSPETLATLTARLGALVGESRCGSSAMLDTHRPDGFEMRRFCPERASGAREPQAQSPQRAHDAHESKGLILRRFRPPIAVRVTVERGRPVRVAIDRRGMPGGHVRQQAGPWRTSGAWWAGAATCWDRDEWDVSLSDGSLCRLFLNRLTERWFLEGVLD